MLLFLLCSKTSKMTDEQIIKQIKNYPVLYDTKMSQYRDLETRNIAWEEIARKVNSNVEDVKTKWGKLRNCYTNALKRRHKKSNQDGSKLLPWKFEKQMDFLLPHLKYRNIRKSKPNVFITVEGSIKDESLSSCHEEFDSQYERTVSPASSAKYVSPIEDDMGSYTPRPSQHNNYRNICEEFVNVMHEPRNKRTGFDLDENDHFFLSMSKLIKKLPKEDQADIKFELHKLIYDAQKRHMKNGTSDQN